MYIAFKNRNDRVKLVIALDTPIMGFNDIPSSLLAVIDDICQKNSYTFMYYEDIDIKILRNVPVINGYCIR